MTMAFQRKARRLRERLSPQSATIVEASPACAGWWLLSWLFLLCFHAFQRANLLAPLADALMSRRDEDDGASADLRPPTRARILERLFRSQGPTLTRYVRSRIGPHEDVQDLVQDAFVRLVAARHDVSMERPEAYLQGIARHLVLDRFRHSGRRGSPVDVPVEEALNVATPPDQEWALEAEDAKRRFVAVLDTLAPKTREIFLLHRVNGLEYAEIARRMALSDKAIQYHMTRALAKLHQAFYGQ